MKLGMALSRNWLVGLVLEGSSIVISQCPIFSKTRAINSGNRREQAINRAAGAAGSRYSGATLKALQRFNSDLSSQEYGNAYNRFQNNVSSRYNRLASLAGIGQTATNQTQQAGTNSANAISGIGQNAMNNINNSMQNAATARASGYVGAGNAINSGLSQWANNQQQQQYLNQMNGGYYTPSQGGFADLNANATNQSGNFAEYGSGYSP